MDIGEVLKRAWEIIWKHKVLWIFGILAGCGSGSGGGGGNFGSGTSWQTEAPPQIQRFFEQITDVQIVLLIAGVILVILILTAVMLFFGTIGSVGLIRGTSQAEEGADKLSFGELFSGSMPYFWRIFLLNLLVGLAIAAVVITLILAVVFGGIVTLGIGLICLIPLLCIMIPVLWVVGAAISVIIEQANAAIVIEDMGIIDGLKRGWEIVRANAGTMAIMWLILGLGLATIGGLVIALPIFLIVGPALIGLATGEQFGITGGLIVSGLCFVAYLPILIVLSGVLQSYIKSAWTLTYLRLRSQPQVVSHFKELPDALE